MAKQEIEARLRAILIQQMVDRSNGDRKETRRREVSVDLPSCGNFAEGSDSGAFPREQTSILENALLRLSEADRAIIYMRHRENLTFAEIGFRLRENEQVVCRNWAKAVKNLQQELQRHESI